jgi:hypothetical protein
MATWESKNLLMRLLTYWHSWYLLPFPTLEIEHV